MVYKVIGLMSGSSLDGLDIAYVHLQERVGGAARSAARGDAAGLRAWDFQLMHTACVPYPDEWRERLTAATGLSAREYFVLHTEYGRWMGGQVGSFVAGNRLEYQVQLIASHGHTVFHAPGQRMTAQLGDGAAIAAETRINVVSDLRAMDVALGGQGAPIVPIGEGMLWSEYKMFLNLGGIANVSGPGGGSGASGSGGEDGALKFGGERAALRRVAFDVAPANRVLNALAEDLGAPFDRDGMMAETGQVDRKLLDRLNALPYYGMGYPKSLANEFGLDEVLPLVRAAGLPGENALRTYVEHLVEQIGQAVEGFGFVGGGMDARAGGAKETGDRGGTDETGASEEVAGTRMLVTGGGAHNRFLVGRLTERLARLGVEVVVPDAAIVDFKEALVMALIGVLRWREENNVLASVTGASRDSIGGAVWIGQEV